MPIPSTRSASDAALLHSNKPSDGPPQKRPSQMRWSLLCMWSSEPIRTPRIIRSSCKERETFLFIISTRLASDAALLRSNKPSDGPPRPLFYLFNITLLTNTAIYYIIIKKEIKYEKNNRFIYYAYFRLFLF